MKKLRKRLMLFATIFAFGIVGILNVKALTVNSKADFFAALLDDTISEIKLDTDIEITNTDYNSNYTFYTNSINRTLDLNGHTVTINKSLGSEYGLIVRARSTGKTATITNSKSTGGIVNNSEKTPIAAFVDGTGEREVALKIDGLNLTTKSSSYPFFTSTTSVNSKLIVTNSEITVTGSSNYDFIRSAEFNIVSLSNMKITRTNTGGRVKIDFSSDSKKVVDVIPSDSEILYDTEPVTITDSTLLNEISVTSGGATSIIIRKKSATPTQHTVTFDLKGGTMTSPTSNSIIVEDGQKITAPTGVKYDTLVFDGWYIKGTSTKYDFNTQVTASLELEAKWLFKTKAIASPSGSGKVSYSVFDSFDTTAERTDNYIAGSSGHGYKVKAESGYKFKEWRKGSPSGEIIGTNTSEDVYVSSDGETLNIRHKTNTSGEYYAIFEPETPIQHTIIVEYGAPSKTSAINGETITITADPAPSGKEFDKWIIEEGTITLADANSSTTTFTMPDENVKVKATYKDIAVTPTYVIESGANQTYTIDSNVDVVIKASGDEANLSKIEFDGTVLDLENYTTAPGSTILTLKANYLNTLSEGDHTVKFVYQDGDVSTNLKVVKNTTGDNSGGNTDPSGTNTNNNTTNPQTSDNIVFYIIAMLLSLFGIAGASVYVNRIKL